MSDCTVNKVYGSIEACPGRSVLAGIRRRLFFIPKSDIVKWPTLPKLNATGDDAAKDMGALATYVGSFTLKADATWKFIDLKDNASNVTHDTVGELGSQIIENKATAIVAGNSKELAGFGRQSKNDDLVYVYQERDGAFRVLGNDMYSTDTKNSSDTAAEATGAKTTTFTIAVYDDCPAPYYEGDLVISKTTKIDCLTGEEKTIAAT